MGLSWSSGESPGEEKAASPRLLLYPVEGLEDHTLTSGDSLGVVLLFIRSRCYIIFAVLDQSIHDHPQAPPRIEPVNILSQTEGGLPG